VHALEQAIDVGPTSALDRLAHQRGRGHRNGAAVSFETQVGDLVALDSERELQRIPTQWIATAGGRIGGLEATEVPRAAVMVQDHVAVQVFEVHASSGPQLNSSRTLCTA
jgi:hypothetical protein